MVCPVDSLPVSQVWDIYCLNFFCFLFLKQNLALFLQDLSQFQVISTFKLRSNLLLYFKILKIFRCQGHVFLFTYIFNNNKTNQATG